MIICCLDMLMIDINIMFYFMVKNIFRNLFKVIIVIEIKNVVDDKYDVFLIFIKVDLNIIKNELFFYNFKD